MSVLLALVLGLARPPGAYLTTGTSQGPARDLVVVLGLALRSADRVLHEGGDRAPRSDDPGRARLRADQGDGRGRRPPGGGDDARTRGQLARHAGGGLSLRAASAHGWVIYVCRVALR